MKLVQLEYFSAVCQNKLNISKTAEALNISQPAISNAIKDLEKEFNVKLFTRNGKHLELTKEGEICLVSVRTILNNTSKLADEMYNLTRKKDTLHIGISSMTGSKYTTKIIGEFIKTYPNITFELEYASSPELFTKIEKENLSIAICNIHHNVDYNLRSLAIIPLYKSRLLFCTHKDNPLAKEKAISLKMIENEPLAVKQNNNVKDYTIKKIFLEQGLNPNIPLYLETVDAIKNFVRSGICSSFLFEDMLTGESDIVGIPLGYGKSHNEGATIGLVYKKNHYFSKTETDFISLAKEICSAP